MDAREKQQLQELELNFVRAIEILWPYLKENEQFYALIILGKLKGLIKASQNG